MKMLKFIIRNEPDPDNTGDNEIPDYDPPHDPEPAPDGP